jgi:hypothetical protein
LEQIGEPFGYREQENRSAMIFLDFQEDYVNLLITEIRLEKAYRLDLVFQDDILQKAEIKKRRMGIWCKYGSSTFTIAGQIKHCFFIFSSIK